ncbi:MAG: D-alanine--D-alanine ligase [Synergistaceae bacterium]|jgi:D-alanine-D-alanine ligase|nr:D-alanine--D-alanine ligase [Synergistaceae bacterium]
MKVVVVCGGTSPEREVSLKSGSTVYEKLNEVGLDAIKIDVTSPSKFLKEWRSYQAEGVYIALHGGWGENGYIQACLNLFGIPYTGSGPEASMYAMDKSTAKLFFERDGINTPEGVSLLKGEQNTELAIKLLEKYGEIIVKPNSGGSTVGVTKLTNTEEILPALNLAWESEEKALVEAYIPGKEATVTVFEKEDATVIALPTIEIRPKEGFYDYTNKYTAGCTEYLCPATFPKDIDKEMFNMAVAAHKSLGCRSFSRVDFRVTEEGTPYVLEVNTIPGMTSTSLVPMAVKAYGMDLPEFLSEVVTTSFKINRAI